MHLHGVEVPLATPALGCLLQQTRIKGTCKQDLFRYMLIRHADMEIIVMKTLAMFTDPWKQEVQHTMQGYTGSTGVGLAAEAVRGKRAREYCSFCGKEQTR